MSLSIRKIEQFIEQFNFVLVNVYIKPDKNIYIEIMCKNPIVVLLVHIPPEFNVVQDRDPIPLTKYKMKKEINEERNTATELYNLQTGLEMPYSKPLLLPTPDMERERRCKILKDQYERLKLCLKGTMYKLSLTDEDCVCISSSIYRNEYVRFSQRLYLVLGLADFHNRIRNVGEETCEVLTHMYKLFSDNESLHMSGLEKFMDSKDRIVNVYNRIKHRKLDLKSHIQKYEEVLKNLITVEAEKRKEIQDLKQPQKNSQIKTEMKRNHQIQNAEQDLNEILEIKKTTQKSVIELKVQETALFLRLDQILFESILYFKKTMQQITLLETLLSD